MTPVQFDRVLPVQLPVMEDVLYVRLTMVRVTLYNQMGTVVAPVVTAGCTTGETQLALFVQLLGA